jgi:hypothetical protein
MTTFSGFGPGKPGGPRKLRYDLGPGGGRIEDAPEPKKRTASVHTRFKPFKSAQVHRQTAKDLGLKKVGCMTHFSSEAELNRYLAYEKHHGRDVGWKDF